MAVKKTFRQVTEKDVKAALQEAKQVRIDAGKEIDAKNAAVSAKVKVDEVK